MKKLYYLGYLLFFFASINTCYSENPNWVYYNSYNFIDCLAQDGDYLWIGTSGGGLVKYNKKTEEKTVYNKSNSIVEFSVIDLHIDKNNNLWILNKAVVGSIPKLIKYDGNKFIKINMDSIISKLNYNLTLCSDEDGKIWIPLKTGVARYDGIDWTIFDEDSTGLKMSGISDIKYKNNILWISQDDQLIKYDGNTWTAVVWNELSKKQGRYQKLVIDEEDNLVIGIKFNLGAGFGLGLLKYNSVKDTFNLILQRRVDDHHEWWNLSFDKESNLWYSYDDSIFKLDDTIINSIHIPDTYGNGLLSIAHDDNGISWLALARAGLFKYNNDTITKINLNGHSFLKDYYNSILIAKDNSIWLAGIGVLNHWDAGEDCKQFTLDFNELNGNGVEYVKEDIDGSIWISVSGSNLVQIIDSNHTIYKINDNSVNSRYKKFIFDENGKKWFVGSSPNLYWFDGKDWQNYDSSYSSYLKDNIYDMEKDSKGNLWLATNGLIKFDGTNFTKQQSNNPSFNNLYINQIAITQNDVIYIMGSYKLIKIEANKWEEVKIPVMDLKYDYCYYLKIDKKGNLWMDFFRKGVGKYDGTNWEFFNNVNSGLSDNVITTFTIDQYNNKWFGTAYSGIAVYNEDGVVTGVDEEHDILENMNSLCFPNPAKTLITVKINSIINSKSKIEIYNLIGIKQTEFDFELNAGENSIPIDVSSFSSGVFFVVFNNGNEIRKAVFVKE